MIALLCPTRNRQRQFDRMCASVIATKSDDTTVKIIEGTNDASSYAFWKFPLDCPTVYMWNKLAEIALNMPDNKLFMLAADDIIFDTPGWDKALIEHYNALGNKIHVYHLQDSRDLIGTPHPIVTREYIEAMGYFMPPLFLHWYVDSWTVSMARAAKCFTHLNKFKLIHDKPSDQGKPDETHLHIRHMGWHDRDKAVNATCQRYLDDDTFRLRKAMVGIP